MRIEIDGAPADLIPDSLNWKEPPVLDKDGVGAPIIAPYWGATLSVGIPTEVAHQRWFQLRDGDMHTFILPHPATGVLTTFTAYVDSVAGRFNIRGDCAVMTGFDLTLSKISVTI